MPFQEAKPRLSCEITDQLVGIFWGPIHLEVSTRIYGKGQPFFWLLNFVGSISLWPAGKVPKHDGREPDAAAKGQDSTT